jgi:hypothetical protein
MPLTNAFRDYLGEKITGGTGNLWDTTNGYIGVGDSSTAFAASQTDLVAATNKLRKLMTSGSDNGSGVLTFVTSFGSAEGNYAWAEFGSFNASSGGTMLQRVVSAQGTKTAGQTWTLTLTVTLSV